MEEDVYGIAAAEEARVARVSDETPSRRIFERRRGFMVQRLQSETQGSREGMHSRIAEHGATRLTE